MIGFLLIGFMSLSVEFDLNEVFSCQVQDARYNADDLVMKVTCNDELIFKDSFEGGQDCNFMTCEGVCPPTCIPF